MSKISVPYQRIEQSGEAGGYEIATANTGWVVRFWSRAQGSITGLRVLVRYGASGYSAKARLADAHNAHGVTVADVIADHAASLGPGARLLHRGWVVR